MYLSKKILIAMVIVLQISDCNGECGGDAVVDECGICEGDGSLCTVGLSLSR